MRPNFKISYLIFCSNLIHFYCEWLGGMGPTNLKLHLKSAFSSNFAQNEEKFLTLKFYSFMWEKLLGIGQLHSS